MASAYLTDNYSGTNTNINSTTGSYLTELNGIGLFQPSAVDSFIRQYNYPSSSTATIDLYNGTTDCSCYFLNNQYSGFAFDSRDIYLNWSLAGYDGVGDLLPNRAYKRSKIKAKLYPAFVRRYGHSLSGVSPEEQVALETLREMISEKDFRKYLKYGYILVEGSSGDIFQIFRDRHHVKVWRNGVLVEEICIYIPDSSVPKTDSVIAFKTMIESSEEDFKRMGNHYRNLARAA